VTCDRCDCEATVETAWGDTFCAHCYEAGPTTDLCPNCSEPDSTGTPVASVAVGSDAPVPAHSPVGTGAVIRPSLDEMEGALFACLNSYQRENRGDGPALARLVTAEHAIDVLRLAVTVAKAYRTQGHAQADDPDYWQLWVPKVVAELGDELIRKVARS
jgi:hypothetical protein